MSEFKDLLPLLGVLVGASIATFSQWLLARRESDEASKKLRILKIEDTLESIAYNKKILIQVYTSISNKYSSINSVKDSKITMSDLPSDIDSLWRHEAKISMLVNTYFPHLSKDYEVLEEIIKENTNSIAQMSANIKLIDPTSNSKEDMNIHIENVKVLINDSKNKLIEKAESLEEKLYKELRNLIR